MSTNKPEEHAARSPSRNAGKYVPVITRVARKNKRGNRDSRDGGARVRRFGEKVSETERRGDADALTEEESGL